MSNRQATMLRKFQYLWERDPRWLMHLPGIPDARRYPDRAIHAARMMIFTPDHHRAPDSVGAIQGRIAA